MKKTALIMLAALMLLLSGCSAVDSRLEQILLDRSGIHEDEEYVRYKSYEESGKLDEEGRYIAPTAQNEHAGQIHVTFASNPYLSIVYFSDADMTAIIDTDGGYFNPGDVLYAKVLEYNNKSSNLYRLAEYRVVEYNSDNSVKKETRVAVEGDSFEYQIPNNLSGTELSIVPVGEYSDRSLSLNVFYVDDDGNQQSLGNAGDWYINNSPVTGNKTGFSPVESYVLKFEIDRDNYFYIGSEPKCFTKDPNETGFVEFWEANSTDNDMEYRVELHQYLNVELEFTEKAEVRTENGEQETVKNKKWGSDKLQYGDSVIVETKGECKIVGGDERHFSIAKDKLYDGCYRYTLRAVQKAHDIYGIALDTQCRYGECSYKLDGKKVSGEILVRPDQTLELIYKVKAENFGAFVRSIFTDKEKTVIIPITPGMDGTTINPDYWIDAAEKGA